TCSSRSSYGRGRVRGPRFAGHADYRTSIFGALRAPGNADLGAFRDFSRGGGIEATCAAPKSAETPLRERGQAPASCPVWRVKRDFSSRPGRRLHRARGNDQALLDEPAEVSLAPRAGELVPPTPATAPARPLRATRPKPPPPGLAMLSTVPASRSTWNLPGSGRPRAGREPSR